MVTKVFNEDFMGQPPVNTQPAEKRVKNFAEVSLGYSKRQAMDEARRCIQCATPVCSFACPLGIDIPGFIRHIRENEPDKALARIKQQNMLASVCGRLCPAPCEKACVFEPEGAPIGIRALERFAADHAREKSPADSQGRKTKKAAIIGSGPAALSAAGELIKSGFAVTLFEALPEAGGALRYAIPEFRLPKKILETEIKSLQDAGLEIRTDFLFGQTATLEDLKAQGFAAVLLAIGKVPEPLEIPGNNLGGVYYAEEFLMRVNIFHAGQYPKFATPLNIGKNIVVIGSGYAALDAARTVVRLGRQATVVFQRTEEELEVRPVEREYAKEEGVTFEPLVSPIAILADDRHFVRGLQVRRMDFADPDSSGHWQLIAVADSEYIIEADTVIIALGQRGNSWLKKKCPELKWNEEKKSWTQDDSGMISVQGVFVVNNLQGHNGSVVGAMAAGKKAAAGVIHYLES